MASESESIFDINADKLKIIADSYLRDNGFISHHINSYNNLIEYGLKIIFTNLFSIKNAVIFTGDKNIYNNYSKIDFNITFPHVHIVKPQVIIGNKIQQLLPKYAEINSLTYKAAIKVTISIVVNVLNNEGNIIYTKSENIEDFEIGQIPMMVKSKYCNLFNMTPNELKNCQEDPKLMGGYFILDGKQYCIMSTESIQYNMFHVMANNYKGERARGIIISKSNMEFDNSFQVIIRYMENMEITIEIANDNTLGVHIPFYLLYRILGMTCDKDIFNTILFDVDSDDELTKMLLNKLSLTVLDSEIKDKRFTNLRFNRNQIEVAQHFANIFTKRVKTNQTENDLRYNMTVFLERLDRVYLPHVGTKPSDRLNKLRETGLLIRKLLLCVNGIKENTDKYSYQTKRILTPSNAIAATFKRILNNTCIANIRQKFKTTFANKSPVNVELGSLFRSAFTGSDIIKALITAIKSGAQEVMISGLHVADRIPSQIIDPKNGTFIPSIMRTISPPSKSGKAKSTLASRALNPSYCGYICSSQSSDTGDKVGKVKQMGITADITSGSSSDVLYTMLLEHENIIDINLILSQDIMKYKLFSIIFNGLTIGVTNIKPNILAKEFRVKRRKNLLNKTTTIYVDQTTQDLYFWTDGGRIIRPLIVVENGDILITDEIVKKITRMEMSFKDLVDQGMIDYITPDEADNCLIAPDYETLMHFKGDPTMQYTHCEIPAAIFGVTALISPAGHHTFSQRITYMTNHAKQACGIPMLNWVNTLFSRMYVQYECEMPLVTTFIYNHLPPNGANLIVAYMSFKGFGQEDALIANKDSFERGIMSLFVYSTQVIQLRDNESIIDYNTVKHMNTQSGNYDKLVKGIMPIGTVIEYGDVILCKGVKTESGAGDKNIKLTPHISKDHERQRLVNIIPGKDSDNRTFYKIITFVYRPVSEGDKLASREGNKSIASTMIKQADMPFTVSGLVPDIIVSPHSFIKRMIIGQPIEAILSKICARAGASIDLTTFTKVDYNAINRECKKYGIEFNGSEKMINPETGETYDSLIFICTTYYQRLQKFVESDFLHAVSRTAYDVITRQPIKGKRIGGGIRFGEMEKDALASHGAINTMAEKMLTHSDGCQLTICTKCNSIVSVINNIALCKICNTVCKPITINAKWIIRLMELYLQGAHIGIKYHTDKLTFYKSE